jgi:translation initiation factor IF-1
MASDDLIEVEGTVTEVYPAGKFLVHVEQGQQGMNVLAHLGGKMRQHQIRVVLGDKVRVEVSPYDLTKGRIVYRQK